MPIPIGFRDGATDDMVILPPREHPCVLRGVSLTQSTAYQSTDLVDQIKWEWEGMQFRSPEGKPGIITLWTGLNYGGSKAKLTALFDQMFGRSLSQQEAGRLDPEKLAGAVKGFVMVLSHRKQDGTMTSKFGGFRLPDNKPALDPRDFYSDGMAPGSALPSQPSATARAVAAPASDPLADEDDDLSDLSDPFKE